MKPLTFFPAQTLGALSFLWLGLASSRERDSPRQRGKKRKKIKVEEIDRLHCSTVQKPCRWQRGRSPMRLLWRSLTVIHPLRLSRFHHENPRLRGGAVRQARTSLATVVCPHPPVRCHRAHPGLTAPHRAVGNVWLQPRTELLLSEHRLDFLQGKMKIRRWFLASLSEGSSTSGTDRWGIPGGRKGIFM